MDDFRKNLENFCSLVSLKSCANTERCWCGWCARQPEVRARQATLKHCTGTLPRYSHTTPPSHNLTHLTSQYILYIFQSNAKLSKNRLKM
ncbi:hypothetical protein RR48_07448 [Papilio machaon]|uniref:Uncharacterized protein n=1 Tax=Papilio machaon TaxID=76193 RepID=A0A194RR27_PAPMA|nr:hypothetical protein RR48_07448 [Papilio machaon]